MPRVSAQWKGLTGSASVLRTLRVDDIPKEELKNVRRKALRVAKRHAPVKTGHLRRNIGSRVLDERLAIGDVRRKVPYMVYQEYGTRHIRPKRFLKRGLASVQQELSDRLERNLRKRLRIAGWK